MNNKNDLFAKEMMHRQVSQSSRSLFQVFRDIGFDDKTSIWAVWFSIPYLKLRPQKGNNQGYSTENLKTKLITFFIEVIHDKDFRDGLVDEYYHHELMEQHFTQHLGPNRRKASSYLTAFSVLALARLFKNSKHIEDKVTWSLVNLENPIRINDFITARASKRRSKSSSAYKKDMHFKNNPCYEAQEKQISELNKIISSDEALPKDKSDSPDEEMVQTTLGHRPKDLFDEIDDLELLDFSECDENAINDIPEIYDIKEEDFSQE